MSLRLSLVRINTVFLSIFLIFCSFKQSIGQSSPMASGEWYKLQIKQRSVYRITENWLQDKGIQWNGVTSDRIAIYTSPEGMLPQATQAYEGDGLEECAIQVVDGNDGRFDSGDYILFWGVSAGKLKEAQEIFFEIETNLYSSESFVFLTLKEEGLSGKRTETTSGITFSPSVSVSSGIAVQHFEKEIIKPITQSGRKWYGDQFSNGISYTHSFSLPQVDAGKKIKIQSSLLKRSANATQVTVTANGQSIGTHSINGHTICSSCPSGIEDEELFTWTYSGESELNLAWSSQGNINLDYATVNYYRDLTLESSPFEITLLPTGQVIHATFRSSVGSPSLWEVNDLYEVKKIPLTQTGETYTFANTATNWKSFFLFTPDQLPTPVFKGEVENQNLLGDLSPQMVVIYHPEFQQETMEFVQYRQRHSNLTVKAVSIQQVYNEFSGGRQDVSAIRDYMYHLYHNGGEQLKYLLLVGRGSFDFRAITQNKNVQIAPFIPTYESHNSLHPVYSFASDDYFGLLEDHEGTWSETLPSNETMDIAVGRLPATDPEQLRFYLEKLKIYESEIALGSWNQNVVMITDDGDNNSHMRTGDRLVDQMLAQDPTFKAKKVYLDALRQIKNKGEGTSPETIRAIREGIEEGAFLVSYIGHGREDLLANEGIVTEETIDAWLNKNRYPIFATGTCQFGRHDDPFQISGAEQILFRRKAGGIALVTTARPIYNYTNERLNIALFNAMFNGTKKFSNAG